MILNTILGQSGVQRRELPPGFEQSFSAATTRLLMCSAEASLGTSFSRCVLCPECGA
jgi:hypothetical protein